MPFVANFSLERILATVSRPDYEDLVAHLKPEMEYAKKSISGKQIIQVSIRTFRARRDELTVF